MMIYSAWPSLNRIQSDHLGPSERHLHRTVWPGTPSEFETINQANSGNLFWGLGQPIRQAAVFIEAVLDRLYGLRWVRQVLLELAIATGSSRWPR